MFEKIALAFMGLSAGMVIAVGAASLAAAIGIYPRLLAKANGTRASMLAENTAMLGILFGNVLSVFNFLLPALRWLLPFAGFFMGVYVGCLLMALAEVLQAFPIMFRRFHIKRGMGVIIICLALGKLVGSLCFFFAG